MEFRWNSGIEETRNKIARPTRLERVSRGSFYAHESGYNAENQISRKERGNEGTREKRECGHACGVTDKGLSLSPLVWVGWVEWILQIAFNVTLTAGEYVQFILMETYRNITSALPTTNWLFKPIPPHYRLSNCARDYSSTIRNYNASYRRRNSTNSLFYIRYVWKYKTWI